MDDGRIFLKLARMNLERLKLVQACRDFLLGQNPWILLDDQALLFGGPDDCHDHFENAVDVIRETYIDGLLSSRCSGDADPELPEKDVVLYERAFALIDLDLDLRLVVRDGEQSFDPTDGNEAIALDDR